MKKLCCYVLSLMLCLMASTAFAAWVPRSASSLPDLPAGPTPPSIIRMQREGNALTLTLDRALPAGAAVTVLAIDADCRTLSFLAQPSGDNAYTAAGLPAGGQWTGVEIAWADALIRYNAAGGLETASSFDAEGNEYLYDNDSRFWGYADADSSLQARFNTRGVMTRYGYEAFRNTTVWFSAEGKVVCAQYRDGSFAASWEPEVGWFVSTPTGRVKVKLNVKSPWDAKPLTSPSAEDVEKAEETIWYPNNTIVVAGLTLQEASATLPDKWYNVLPIDLTKEGRQTYYLTISNMHYVGRCYVDVWGDEVTVSTSLLDNTAIEPLSSYGRWFTSLSQITAESIESTENGFVFGETLSISEDLGGADVALLFIRSKASYYLPFRDGTSLTRYWRNQPQWKEFREGLQELMPMVEK